MTKHQELWFEFDFCETAGTEVSGQATITELPRADTGEPLLRWVGGLTTEGTRGTDGGLEVVGGIGGVEGGDEDGDGRGAGGAGGFVTDCGSVMVAMTFPELPSNSTVPCTSYGSLPDGTVTWSATTAIPSCGIISSVEPSANFACTSVTSLPTSTATHQTGALSTTPKAPEEISPGSVAEVVGGTAALPPLPLPELEDPPEPGFTVVDPAELCTLEEELGGVVTATGRPSSP